MLMDKSDIVSKLPYAPPFLFVDEILEIDENGCQGTFTYHESLDFYRGHFVDRPITPAVILTETMAQIGLVCLGIYLNPEINPEDMHFAFTSSEVNYLKPVYPNEKVWVTSEKVYYRFGKLKCNVVMKNTANEVVAQGTLSGIKITPKNNCDD